MKSKGLRYLFWCANEHLDFRIPEFESLAKLFRINLQWVEKNEKHPWIILDLESEMEAKSLISRSISTKYCIQLWADGTDYASFHQSLKSFPSSLMEPYCKEDQSFKVEVEAFMKKLTVPERIKRIEAMSYIPFQGKVKLKHPDLVFSNFEFYGFDQNNLPDEPTRIFFGRCIGEGQRDVITKLSIKTRKFIGNTTMDPQLSLLMANLAGVGPGDMVLDPFVGTGSLLIAAAQFGGLVFGSDIDYLMLHARTRPSRVGQKKRSVDETFKANFEQYGLSGKFADVAVADFSRPLWKNNTFDAIITDPPYGIREPMFKVGTTRENIAVPEEYLGIHFPSKVEYELGDVYRDILNYGSEILQENRRLVFWIPVIREDYTEESLPKHPRLKLVANCEQVLSSHTSRRLLVMEKKSKNEEGGARESVNLDTVTLTASQFRDHFYKSTQNIPRKERKERVKKYGHLNVKGDPAVVSNDEPS